MPIKNYSSGVSPAQSMGLIQQLLAEHKARNISIDYGDNAKPEALTFTMMIDAVMVPFRLTVDVEAMLGAMKKDPKVPGTACNWEQAERTVWKNKFEWLHLQMAEIQSGQARIEQLLLGYAVTPQGDTLFDAIKKGNNQLLLSD